MSRGRKQLESTAMRPRLAPRRRVPSAARSARVGLWLLALGGWLCAPRASAAPPTMEFVEPAGAQRGTEVMLKVGGTFAHWPPQVWVDRPGVQLSPGEKSGELKLSAAADAAPGIYWFRLIDADGASRPQPVVVGLIPEVVQVEPNNTPRDAQVVALPVTINGRLEERGDVDVYAVSIEAGQTLVAALDGNRAFASPMDAVLQICDERGIVLAQNDDARGLDPLLSFRAPKSGKYLVRAFAFPATPNSSIAFSGGANYVYRLTITTAGFLDYALPLAAPAGESSAVLPGGWNLSDAAAPLVVAPRDDEAATLFRTDLAGALEVPLVAANTRLLALAAGEEAPLAPLPLVASGCLQQPGETHAVRFVGAKKQKLRIEVAAHQLGYDLDPQLRVYSPDGTLLREVDDMGADQDDIDLEQPLPADGEYRIVVGSAHDAGGPRQVYRLHVREATAEYRLTLDAGEFSLQPAGEAKVVVKIARSKDATGDMTISAVDLPAGVTAEPVVSEGKGASAKSVTLTLKATAEAVSGTFRVVGNLAEDTPVASVARYNVTGSLLGESRAWLTVLAPPAK